MTNPHYWGYPEYYDHFAIEFPWPLRSSAEDLSDPQPQLFATDSGRRLGRRLGRREGGEGEVGETTSRFFFFFGGGDFINMESVEFIFQTNVDM